MIIDNSMTNIQSYISLDFDEHKGVREIEQDIPRTFDFDFDENSKVLHIKNIDRPFCCPKCGAEKFKRTGSADSRALRDIVEQMPVDVIVDRYRYRCHGCNRRFTDDIYPEKIQYTPEYENYLAQTMVNENRYYRDMSQKYDISVGQLSDVLDSYIKRFKEQGFQLESCTYLYFHKFSYHGKDCCCVCGSDGDAQNDLKLLEIYEEYSPKIVKTVYEKLSSIDNIEAIFHDYDPPVTAALQRQFSRQKVLIHCQNFIKRAYDVKEKHNRSLGTMSSNPDDAAYEGKIGQEMLNYINYIEENLHGSNVATHLKRELSDKLPEVNNAFSELISKVESYKPAFRGLKKYKNIEFNAIPITNEIKKFNDNNTSFQVMYIRMMILSKALRRKLKQTYLGTYLKQDPSTMFNMSPYDLKPTPIGNKYYTRSIDVKELVEELSQDPFFHCQYNTT